MSYVEKHPPTERLRPFARWRADRPDRADGSYLLGRCAAALAIFSAILASTTPSPLYGVYVAQWGLAPSAATTIFCVYAIGTLVALFLSGRLDRVTRDRRMILLPGLAMTALGAILFAMADGMTMLLAGRLLSGFSTGLIAGTASAALHDLDRPEKRRRAATIATVAFTGGAFTGPCVSSFALSMDIAPLVTPFLVIAGSAMLAFAGLLLADWPRAPAAKAAPPADAPTIDTGGLQSRAANLRLFRLSCLGIAIAWVIGSVLMAIGVSIAIDIFGIGAILLAGFVPALFQLLGGIGQVLAGRIPPLTALLAGFAGLAVLQALIGVGAIAGLTWLFLLAIPLAGLSYGAAFVGSAALVNASSEPDELAGRISGFYVVGYLSNAVPTFALGLMIDRMGLLTAYTSFAAIVAVLAAVGAVLALRERARAALV